MTSISRNNRLAGENALDQLARQIDDTAASIAASAYLAHLAGRREVDFWTLPEKIQADVVLVGCDFADQARHAFAATGEADADVLAEVWHHAASQFQVHVDRLLIGAAPGGRA